MQTNSPTNKTVIVTLNWNGTTDTLNLLKSLQKEKLQFPVWIIDNGSDSDDTEAFLAAYPSASVIRLGENFGFAGGMNRAIEKAIADSFEFVYEINNDCLVTNDVVTPCLREAINHPSAAIIGSRYVNKDQQGEYTKWGFHSSPEEEDGFIHGLLSTDRVGGCAMLIRCKQVMDNGGFDERFFCYGEEVEACWRLLDNGMQVGICKDSLVMHNHQGSDIGSNAAYYRTRNLFLLKEKQWKRCDFFSRELTNNIRNAWTGIAQKKIEVACAYTQGILHGTFRKFGKRPRRPRSIGWLFALILLTFITTPLFLARLFKFIYRHTIHHNKA